MRYLGTHFSLTIGGMRLRVRIDLDDAEEDEKGDGARSEGTAQHVDVRHRAVPHHLRSRRA